MSYQAAVSKLDVYRRFLFLKAEQLGLFGTPRTVLHPGSRGGHGYFDEHAQWQYGERPIAAAPVETPPPPPPAAPPPPPEAPPPANPKKPPQTDFLIPDVNFEQLVERVGKLNARAKRMKLGPEAWSPIVVEKRGEVFRDVLDEFGEKTGRKRRFYEVHVEGKTPKYAGWEFWATIQHGADEDGTLVNVVRQVPGHEEGVLPDVYRTVGSLCEHCRVNRRRIDTFVLRNDSGTWKQVGRDCLADFLGHQSPEQLARAAELLGELGDCQRDAESERDGAGGTDFADREDIMAYAAAAINKLGWRSRQMSGSTFDTMLSSMFPPKEWSAEQRKKHCVYPEKSDRKDAADAIDWLVGQGEYEGRPFGKTTALSDFEWNVHAAVRPGVVQVFRSGAIVAAGMMAFLREKGRLAEIARKKASPTGGGKYFGTVGERGNFTLTLTGVLDLGENQYGTSYLAKFVDQDGNDATWFTGKHPSRDIYIDAHFKVGDVVATGPTEYVTRYKLNDGEGPEVPESEVVATKDYSAPWVHKPTGKPVNQVTDRVEPYWEVERGKGKKKTVTRYTRDELDAGKDGAVYFPTEKRPEWAIGDTWEVKATVKAHDTFREALQTKLTRVSQVKKVEPIAKSSRMLLLRRAV